MAFCIFEHFKRSAFFLRCLVNDPSKVKKKCSAVRNYFFFNFSTKKVSKVLIAFSPSSENWTIQGLGKKRLRPHLKKIGHQLKKTCGKFKSADAMLETLVPILILKFRSIGP